ncbi:unnamed protein product [Ranitomeya imitator]|uniref:Uncharacterized protein n=1 Tax=Ranitomeya imitator TaxID=111125 RepID=A0ABN9KZQ9_9NEOB|nr:unnamed protein product [Ranitomeya imitator]
MELQRFYRRIRLVTHFSKVENTRVSDPSIHRALISIDQFGLRNKSTYRPPSGSHAVETFIEFVDKAFAQLRRDSDSGKLHFLPNLTNLDLQASQILREDKNIIIKPADKGGAIVVMDRTDYIKEAYRQLGDNTVYIKLSKDPTNDIRDDISSIL